MTDKEKIIAEIERIKEIHERNLDKPMERGRIGYAHGCIDCCDRIFSFIDSLPGFVDGYKEAYEQAEKYTIERACKWLFSHLPILVDYYNEDIHTNADGSEFIKLFRTQMDDEKESNQ